MSKRTGWNSSNLSRILSGKTRLTTSNQRALSAALECTEAQLHEPIGAPIPPRTVKKPKPLLTDAEAMERRIRALLKLIGVETLEQLMPFVTTGDYNALPDRIAYRLRKIMEQDDDPG